MSYHACSLRRFYPNGQVISLLANEEHEPQHVITILRPTLRMKVRDRRTNIMIHFISSLPGVLYWHVEALWVNCADFEPDGSIQSVRTLLISNDADTPVTSIGPVE
jgi:hypothetical protein